MAVADSTEFPDNDDFDGDDCRMGGSRRISPVFKFGRYKGHSFQEAAESEVGYYFWAKTQKTPSKFINDFTVWIEENYDVNLEEKTLIDKVDLTVFNGWEFSGGPQKTPKSKPSTR